MDKLKNVLHRKSDDATHDSHPSSSTATGEQHPIYDEMTHNSGKEGTGTLGALSEAGGPYTKILTTSGEPYTTLAQPSDSLGHSHNHTRKDHVGTDSPIGASSTTSGAPIATSHTTSGEPTSSSGTTSGGHLRPDANPTGREGVNTGMSGASIKSGVIGFGAGEDQGHAALSTHNPTEQYMDRNQVVGGGDPGTAAMTEGQNLPSSTGSPYDNTLRQESYTADTDRSFPLAGGVASRHQHEPIQQQTISEREPGTTEREAGVQEGQHEGHGKEAVAGATAATAAGGLFARHREHEQTSSTQHEPSSEREPRAKEKEVVQDGHERKGLAGLFSRHREHDSAAPTQRQTTSEREPGTKEREVGVQEGQHEGHGKEAVAGAAAATTAGGLFARHREHEHTSPTQHQTTNEREPGINEREVGVPEGHGRDGLAGTAATTTGGLTSRDYEQGHTSAPQHVTFRQQEPELRELSSHDDHHEGHGREGLAGAAAAATAIGASKALPRSEERDIKDQGLEPRQATYGDVPSANYQRTDPTTGPTGSTLSGPQDSTTGSTTHHNPAALAAATAAASKSSTLSPSAQEPGYGTQDRDLPGVAQTSSTGGPTSQTFGLGALDRERPHGTRSASHRHIPGEFPSPTPGDESKTFLDYGSVVEPTSDTGLPSGQHSYVEPSSTTADVPTGQHELRHTGSLAQPQSRSSDLPSEHHYGRDAALAGGLGAGAGLGTYAASHQRETPDDGNKPLYEESSPYSSKTLDPRVLGTKANIEEPRSVPQAQSDTLPHHSAQTSNPAGISATSGPTPAHETARTEDPQHHYGRDAALVGAGAATAGGLHHSLQRNDTPGTGTAVVPQDSSYNSSPKSSSTVPQQPANIFAPISGGSVPQQRSAGNDTFYGTSGAPAPVVGRSSPQQQSLSNLGHTSTPVSSAVPEKESHHHYGRDATLAGAGAATAGGLYAASRDNEAHTGPASSTIGPHNSNAANVLDPRVQPDPSKQVHHNVGSTTQDPASKTIGPHDSNIANILDPRVQPDPSKQKGHTTTGPHQSDTLNRADPKVDQKEKAGQQGEHHYGRDAAVVGGTGAAGYGAYEAAQAYGEHRSTQPGASMNEQRYDPTATGANAPSPVPAQGHYNYNDPNTTSNLHRNAALGTGAGLGAAGAGATAYAGTKHADNTQDLPFHQRQDFASSNAAGSVAQPGPTQGTIAPQNTHTQGQHYDPSQDRSEQHNDKRDAALLGTAGAAAAGGGAYAYSQHEQGERERARLEHEQQERLKKEAHDREKEQHRLDKEEHKHEKEAEKLEKEQHKHDKAVVAAQHKHEKEVAAHEKEQHRLEKEELKREKEAEKEHEGEEKKKGGLFGFLHRDKSKKEKKDGSSPETSPRHSKEYAAAGTAGALGVGTTAAAYDEENDPNSPRWKGRNLLHKDPPPGHPAREALEQQQQGEHLGGKREHVGVDGPIGDPNLISGDRETSKGVYGAHDVSDVQQNTSVIEPTTGLPMNVGKYGTGTGGTDGNATIEGFHQGHGATASPVGHQTGGYETTADREAIRKADTPY